METITLQMVYRLHAVREARRTAIRPLQRLLVLGTDQQFGDMCVWREPASPVHLEPGGAFDRFVPAGSHRGIMGLAAAKAYVESDDILSLAQAPGRLPCWSCLTVSKIRITSGNSWTPRRPRQDVFVPERRAVGLTSVVAKASAGAVDHMPMDEFPNLSRLIARLQGAGLWVYALDAEAPRSIRPWIFEGLWRWYSAVKGRGFAPVCAKPVTMRRISLCLEKSDR